MPESRPDARNAGREFEEGRMEAMERAEFGYSPTEEHNRPIPLPSGADHRTSEEIGKLRGQEALANVDSYIVARWRESWGPVGSVVSQDSIIAAVHRLQAQGEHFELSDAGISEAGQMIWEELANEPDPAGNMGAMIEDAQADLGLTHERTSRGADSDPDALTDRISRLWPKGPPGLVSPQPTGDDPPRSGERE